MRKIFFGVISILVIAGLAWFFFWQKQLPATAPGEQVNETAEKAWVEVINRGVYLVNEDGTLGSELKTGDEVESGQTLMTDNVGLANLHFSDSSVVRLETQTKVDLKDFAYFADSKTLKVKIFLQSGRVWSRIKALMTTESYWEVETANAVAAVRGTAFGVVYVPGQTTVIGSVHLINVNAIDPQAKKMIENNTAFVGAEQYIKINDQDITGLLGGVKLVSKVKPYTQAIVNDSWVIKQKNLDQELEGQTATTTIVRPKPDDELITKPVKEQTEDSLSPEDKPIIIDEEAVQRPIDEVENPAMGGQSYSEPVDNSQVEEDFYYATDDSTKGDLTDDSQINDYPVGAAPDTSVDNNQTSSSEDYIDPTHDSSGTLEKTTTTTTVKPTINLRPINLIR